MLGFTPDDLTAAGLTKQSEEVTEQWVHFLMEAAEGDSGGSGEGGGEGLAGGGIADTDPALLPPAMK